MSETLRNIRRKQEGISLGIRQAERSLCCGVQCEMVVVTCMISGFWHEVDEICALLGYHKVYSGNSLKNYHQDLLKEWVGMYRIALLLQVEDERSKASLCLSCINRNPGGWLSQ